MQGSGAGTIGGIQGSCPGADRTACWLSSRGTGRGADSQGGNGRTGRGAGGAGRSKKVGGERYIQQGLCSMEANQSLLTLSSTLCRGTVMIEYIKKFNQFSTSVSWRLENTDSDMFRQLAVHISVDLCEGGVLLGCRIDY